MILLLVGLFRPSINWAFLIVVLGFHCFAAKKRPSTYDQKRCEVSNHSFSSNNWCIEFLFWLWTLHLYELRIKVALLELLRSLFYLYPFVIAFPSSFCWSINLWVFSIAIFLALSYSLLKLLLHKKYLL